MALDCVVSQSAALKAHLAGHACSIATDKNMVGAVLSLRPEHAKSPVGVSSFIV